MVNIAIAGGTSDVASEIIDALCAAQKHNVLLLSRQDAPKDEPRVGVRWAKTNYGNTDDLAQLLKGVHTVLSFVDPMKDQNGVAQRNLIDASVRAGVKRFAPSEWSISNVEAMPWYAGKAAIRKYLAELNKDKKTLEYCIFAPGFFSNYYTSPHASAKHLHQLDLNIDFNNRRAFIIEDGDNDRMTLTTVQDLANLVARAVEYEGEWPIMGGMKGSELSVGELIQLGEKIRGGRFDIERLKADDLKAGEVKSSWLPDVGHYSVPSEQWKPFVPQMMAGLLLATSIGALSVSDEWNQLLPEYKFTPAKEFLSEAWHGRA